MSDTVTLATLISEVSAELYAVTEFPRHVVVGSAALETTAATQLTLGSSDDAQHVGVSDVLETPGGELLLVTARSDDAVPQYTVARGYMGTDRGTAATGSRLLLNPAHTRDRIIRAIRRGFDGPLAAHLPCIRTDVISQPSDLVYVPLPAETIRVLEVRYMDPGAGRIIDIDGWVFENYAPPTVIPTGKALRVPTYVEPEDDLWVTLHVPWTWTGTGEQATITVPPGARDLPVLFAVAYLVSGREVSKADLDRVEEWNQEQAVRQGISIRLTREMWSNFYRRLDEARRVHPVPRTRVYRKWRTR
jgi:hypothetical protein